MHKSPHNGRRHNCSSAHIVVTWNTFQIARCIALRVHFWHCQGRSYNNISNLQNMLLNEKILLTSVFWHSLAWDKVGQSKLPGKSPPQVWLSDASRNAMHITRPPSLAIYLCMQGVFRSIAVLPPPWPIGYLYTPPSLLSTSYDSAMPPGPIMHVTLGWCTTIWCAGLIIWR